MPLFPERELNDTPDSQLFHMFLACPVQCGRLAARQIARPFIPAVFLIEITQAVEEYEVFQPP